MKSRPSALQQRRSWRAARPYIPASITARRLATSARPGPSISDLILEEAGTQTASVPFAPYSAGRSGAGPTGSRVLGRQVAVRDRMSVNLSQAQKAADSNSWMLAAAAGKVIRAASQDFGSTRAPAELPPMAPSRPAPPGC